MRPNLWRFCEYFIFTSVEREGKLEVNGEENFAVNILPTNLTVSLLW